MSVSSNIVNALLVTLGSLNNDLKFEVLHSTCVNGVATVFLRVDNIHRFSGNGTHADPEQARYNGVLDALKNSGYQIP
jgi:hypothetical protein